MSDSPWAFIGSIAYNYHFRPDEALDITLQNLVLYNAALPSIAPQKKADQRQYTFGRHNQQEIDCLLGLK